MPFQIVRNDLAAMKVDAIVSPTGPMPVIGGGAEAAIHQKAGAELLAARKRLGRMEAGMCAVTPAFGLDARFVIHAVGPVWRGGLLGEGKQLRKCYESALQLAEKHGCESIAIPLISTGSFGFPRERAMQIALSAISAYLMTGEMKVYLVVYDGESFRLSERLFDEVESYIDEHYIREQPVERCCMLRRMPMAEPEEPLAYGVMEVPMAAPSMTLESFLRHTDAGFSETLLKLIDESGRKDSDVYKRALLSKQHFSKIRNNPDYKPTKPTAIALALALELDLDATRDLLGRAGYALTSSSKFDLIIRYCIEHRMYNLVEINCILFEYDQSLLGT